MTNLFFSVHGKKIGIGAFVYNPRKKTTDSYSYLSLPLTENDKMSIHRSIINKLKYIIRCLEFQIYKYLHRNERLLSSANKWTTRMEKI